MGRMSVGEALSVCKEFSQFDQRFEGRGPKRFAKQAEHLAGFPFLRRQRIFNGHAITVMERLIDSSKRADALIDERLELVAHQDNIAALRRDLSELQQQLAEVQRLVAALPAAAPAASAASSAG